MATLTDLTGYRRVSTAGQVTDGLGLPVQQRRIREYAKPNGIHVLGWETDPGLSGTLDDAARPGILACLKAVQSGQSQGIIITDLGRLSRLLTVQEAILAKVWSLGGIVVTVESGIVPKDDPDDPMRTAMRQMSGVFFQLERAMVIKRLRNGRQEKALQGGYACGAPQFGMRADDGDLVTDDTEQATVATMRQLRSQGMSLRDICGQLNRSGQAPKRGGTWHPTTVARVLAR